MASLSRRLPAVLAVGVLTAGAAACTDSDTAGPGATASVPVASTAAPLATVPAVTPTSAGSVPGTAAPIRTGPGTAPVVTAPPAGTAPPGSTASPVSTPAPAPSSPAPGGPTSVATPPPPPAGLTPVPSVAVTTAAPVAPTATATASSATGRVLVSIAGVRSVKTAGRGPGEVAGAPAIAVTLAVRNDTSQPLDLGQVSVTAAYGPAATPAPGSDGPPAQPLAGTLRTGAVRSGVYVFRVPVAQRSRVDLAVSYLAGQPIILFRGRVGS